MGFLDGLDNLRASFIVLVFTGSEKGFFEELSVCLSFGIEVASSVLWFLSGFGCILASVTVRLKYDDVNSRFVCVCVVGLISEFASKYTIQIFLEI